MSKLVSPEIAGELLDTTGQALMTMACLRRKENGVYPRWYVSEGKMGGSSAYVDVEIIERYNQIRKKAWNYATNDLYWLLDSVDGYSMTDFATILAKHTEDSINSWVMYLSRDMWNIPSGNVYNLKQTKLFNFIRIMTRWVYENKSSLKFNEAF